MKSSMRAGIWGYSLLYPHYLEQCFIYVSTHIYAIYDNDTHTHIYDAQINAK